VGRRGEERRGGGVRVLTTKKTMASLKLVVIVISLANATPSLE
jgi:hypothetical protein